MPPDMPPDATPPTTHAAVVIGIDRTGGLNRSAPPLPERSKSPSGSPPTMTSPS